MKTSVAVDGAAQNKMENSRAKNISGA